MLFADGGYASVKLMLRVSWRLRSSGGRSPSLVVARRQGPTVLDIHIGLGRDADLAAERPISATISR